MQESPLCFHNLEWPPAGATVAGPDVWLRGWLQPKPGQVFVDVRARSSAGNHLGVLGLPRVDLAQHFPSSRPWLPAEFVVGVPATDGPADLALEARDDAGNWHPLQRVAVQVAPDGLRPPRVEGAIAAIAGGTTTERGTHLPFHGHLDAPTAHDGLVSLFGWLTHEAQGIRRLIATFDGRVFHHLEHSLTDESLATKVPHLPAARRARFRGNLELPLTTPSPACLRVYAELADGSAHLCFARWVTAEPSPDTVDTRAHPKPFAPPASRPLPEFPSGRPRRLLFVVATLEPEEATLRALDLARALAGSGRWVARLLTAEDGRLRRAFEDGGCAVQYVDLRDYFAAGPAARAAATAAVRRRIWWRHLDAVVAFDEASEWIRELASAEGIAFVRDPAPAMPWAAAPEGKHDPQGALVVPIRGLSRHGAGILRHALARLTRSHPELIAHRPVYLPALGDIIAERLFREDVAFDGAGLFRFDAPPPSIAAIVNPALHEPPQRAVLGGIEAGIPVITTPLAALAPFGPHEVTTIAPGHPLALAHAITDLLARPESAARRAAAARRLSAGRFALSAVLPRWTDAVAGAIAPPPR